MVEYNVFISNYVSFILIISAKEGACRALLYYTVYLTECFTYYKALNDSSSSREPRAPDVNEISGRFLRYA